MEKNLYINLGVLDEKMCKKCKGGFALLFLKVDFKSE
jgi:hypothetical protein